MSILDDIIAAKKREVENRKVSVPVKELEQMPLFDRATASLKNTLTDAALTGIIAEFKRRSPSKGVINGHSEVEEVTRAYEHYGASGISVLTDTDFFGGYLDDLLRTRSVQLPLLRKDFIIDDYQLIEAKAFGADVILLIAACLNKSEIRSLSAAATKLGLEVLLEVHHESELDHICEGIEIVGINNRNLQTFHVDLEHSARMAGRLGNGVLKVAESGIRSAEDLAYLRSEGFDGFLIGERFMKENDPAEAFASFIKSI